MLLFNKYFYRKNKLKLYFGNCVTILNKFILPNQGVYKHVLIQLSKTFFFVHQYQTAGPAGLRFKNNRPAGLR
jgi:hypothetical protein